jgi:DNA-binding LacI/PurR family transcriptional regulator
MKDRPVTIKDIAQKLGISKSTISRVLQDAPDVSEKTRKLVLQTMQELNYRPNIFAQGLKKHRTKTIGVNIPAFDIPFYSMAISGIQNKAATLGYNIITCQSNEDYNTEIKNIETLLSSQVDGMLISISRTTLNVLHLLDLQRKNFPLVLFNRVAGLIDFSKVYVNDEDGAYKMVRYLIEKGYKDIAHIAGPRNLSLSKNRISGYKRALKESDLPYREDLIVEGDFSMANGADCTEDLISRKLDLDAIFCVCDATALGCMEKLQRLGFKIPADIAVAGYTNEPAAAYVNPGLTTISQPAYQIGEEAATLLIDKINNPEAPLKNIVLDTELVVRESA